MVVLVFMLLLTSERISSRSCLMVGLYLGSRLKQAVRILLEAKLMEF